jgi:prepilin-type N-terminal cleavage/methylation domain-containing protein
MRGHASLRSAANSRHNSGFTLIELIISIVLLALLGTVGSTIFKDSFTTARLVDAEAGSEGGARYALDRLAREIREIKYNTTNSSYCISPTASDTTADRLVFYRTIPGSTYVAACALSISTYTVTIARTGANLNMGYTYFHPPTLPADVISMPLSNTVSNPVSTKFLDYLDATGNSLTAPPSASDVRFVLITLVVTDPISGQSISQRTRVALRNS